MSYRRRMELLQERRAARAREDRSERELYYSHRLKLSEEILSRVFCKPVSLVVVGGWVRFNGKNYRVPQIEAHALYLDACMKESENEV